MLPKPFNIFVILMLFFASCNVGDRSIDVMSFNLRYDNPADGINSWDNRKELVLDFLEKKSPDVIGFQEVLPRQLQHLKDELKGYASVAAGRDDGKDNGEMVPIFYKKNKFELISSSHFWLSTTPEIAGSKSWGTHFPRIVTWVQLKNIENGYIFYVFNTHFSHISNYARNESAVLLLEKIRVLAGKAPVVLTGDFNAESTERSYQTIISHWIDHKPLWDARQESLTAPAESYNTFNGFKNDPSEVVIDHIFVNGMFLVQTFETFPIKKDSTFISDHYPIMANLSFRLNEKLMDEEAVELIQSLPDPLFETGQLAFKDNLLVPIKLPGNSAKLYYTLDGSIPDTSSSIYNVPIELKETTTITVFAFSPKKYPSKPISKTFIKKNGLEVEVHDIIPKPLNDFNVNNYQYLFDMKHGDEDLNRESWLGMESGDYDMICKLKKNSQIKDLYISHLSRPKNAILNPKAIEVSVSNDNIHYEHFSSITLVPSTDIKEDQTYISHLNGQKKGQYIKISFKSTGTMPSNSPLKGAPSWIYIDELIIQ